MLVTCASHKAHLGLHIPRSLGINESWGLAEVQAWKATYATAKA